ncbi:MAG TPA: hypothetical protein VF737_00365 [Gemmatimonadaceae bacterium]
MAPPQGASGDPITARSAMMTNPDDVAISAVAYDRMLVRDVIERLTPYLRTRPRWAGDGGDPELVPSLLAETTSRLVLVLHQRLWGHDGETDSHDGILRARRRTRPESIIVAPLDESPLPEWAAGLRSCTLAVVGVDGVADAVLDAMAAAGGSVRAAPPHAPDAPQLRWDTPRAYLTQPRAQTALQHELDALASELPPWFRTEDAQDGTHVVEFPARPYRLIARLDDVGVSFSWVPGPGGAVADGRLLVIEWGGLRRADRGAEALKGATATRERVYRAEAAEPGNWRWRADEPNGRACATVDLVGEWLSGALMARRGFGTA